MTTTLLVTLKDLLPGHEYPGANINARTTYRDAEIKELAALLMEGQLQPLLTSTHASKKTAHFVFDGGRRRLAFELLESEGRKWPEYPKIEIKDFGAIEPAAAKRLSWTANQSVPMHPADRATVFAEMNGGDAPATAEQIADRFGMTFLAVNRSIALGSALADEVLAAWRENVVDKEAAEIFTLGSKEDQVRELAKIKESYRFTHGGGIDLRELRRNLEGNKGPEMRRLLGVVGEDKYVAAGGVLHKDFFTEAGGVVDDMRLLRKLARATMGAIVVRLTEDGWGWVETRLTRSFMHHGHGTTKPTIKYTADEKTRLKAIDKALKAKQQDDPQGLDEDVPTSESAKLVVEREAIDQAALMRGFTADQKAKSGVIVSVEADGALHYEAGLIRREATKGKKKGGGQHHVQPEREPKPLQYAVHNAMAQWQDRAMGSLLVDRADVALPLLLAAIATWKHTGRKTNPPFRPAALEGGIDAGKHVKAKDFAGAFAELKKKKVPELLRILSGVIGAITDVADSHQGRRETASVLFGIVAEKDFQANMAKLFDAKVYFGGASKQHIMGVYKEAFGEAARKNCEDKGVDALRIEAAKTVPATGWLPPELRTKLYVAPKPAVAKKPAKK